MIEAIEFSGLGQAARSSLWVYPLANITHVLGAALLLGAILIFDLHVISGRHRVALDIAPVALGIAALGVAAQVVSGVVLFSAEARALAANPVFVVKMALVALALLNVAAFHWLGRRDRSGLPSRAKFHAALSAVLWVMVVIAGRSIAYV